VAKIRNVSGEDLEVRLGPIQRLVKADEVLSVPDALAVHFESAAWADETPKKGDN
jgi:hypothetical protein